MHWHWVGNSTASAIHFRQTEFADACSHCFSWRCILYPTTMNQLKCSHFISISILINIFKSIHCLFYIFPFVIRLFTLCIYKWFPLEMYHQMCVGFGFGEIHIKVWCLVSTSMILSLNNISNDRCWIEYVCWGFFFERKQVTRYHFCIIDEYFGYF